MKPKTPTKAQRNCPPDRTFSGRKIHIEPVQNEIEQVEDEEEEEEEVRNSSDER